MPCRTRWSRSSRSSPSCRAGIDPESRPPRAFDDVRRLIEVFLQRNVPDENELLVGWWNGGPKRFQGDVHEDLLYDPAFRRAVAERVATGGTTSLDTRWGEVSVTVQPARDRQTRGRSWWPASSRTSTGRCAR